MKRFLIRSTVFVATFILTMIVASRILNKDQNNMTMEMPEATLPVVTMLCGQQQYNRLCGYTIPMDVASQREQLTILDESRSVQLLINTYGRRVTGAEAEVRSSDGTRLVENIVCSDFEEADEEVSLKVALKDLIEKQEEYILVIRLELDHWQEVRYYTRAIWNPDNHLKENLAFVSDFHHKLYDREEAKDLVKYLETNSRLEDNCSFHKVNIHSSFKQITWGDMHISEVGAPKITLKEMNSQSASFLVDYTVADSSGKNKEKIYYRVKEYFRVRYTADRMYLLEYERTMTEIPEEDKLYGGDKLLLGIADEEVEMLENESGSVVAFCQAGRLYSYQTQNQKLARLFSFYDSEHMDDRCIFDEHDIKILRVDEEGNVSFAVYGYMNRGGHEGEVGIQINRYDAALNTIEEIIYIPWRKTFSDLRTQLGQLLYLNEEGMLYLTLDSAVYRVDLTQQIYAKIFDIAYDDSVKVSDNHRILVWQEKKNDEFVNEIKVRDLLTEAQASIRGKADEVLKVLGFMGEDIIYGVAYKQQVTRYSSGQLFFPMYKLCISSADGTLLKEYRQDNIYITDCFVEENQITLERLAMKEDASFIPTVQDHITKTVHQEPGKNHVAVVDIDIYKRYVQIQVAGKIESKLVQVLTPREVIHEGNDDFILETGKDIGCYYVYGPYGVDAIYRSPASAVERAGEVAGTVTNQSGRKIWQKGSRASRNQIMAIKEPEKCAPEESMAVCLDTMLKYKGISVDSAQLLQRGKYPIDILSENMTDVSVVDMSGCSLEAMLYYVNQDIPVLAMLQNGEGVLITGFNESQIVVFQPSQGKLYKKSTSESAKWFEENGNSFLTYFP